MASATSHVMTHGDSTLMQNHHSFDDTSTVPSPGLSQHPTSRRRQTEQVGPLRRFNRQGFCSKTCPRPYAGPRSCLEDFVVDGIVGTGGSATVVRAHRINVPQTPTLSTSDLSHSNFNDTFDDRHEQLGCPLALKAVAKQGLPRKAQRFLAREIAVHRAVGGHDHVVRLYDVFDNKAGIYLVLELLEGGDLFSVLKKKQKALNEYVALSIIEQVFDALTHIHAIGVSHRDIKLENIMFVRKPVLQTKGMDIDVKLVDFGLACARNPTAAGRERLSHESCGTKNYCAPEVIRACAQRGYVPELADIWSTGVVLYAMLTRKLPFQTLHQYMMPQNQVATPFHQQQVPGTTCGYEALCNAHTAHLRFDAPEFRHVSASTVSFLKSLLSTDPSVRPSAVAALGEVRRLLAALPSATVLRNKICVCSPTVPVPAVSSTSASSAPVMHLNVPARRCAIHDGPTKMNSSSDVYSHATRPTGNSARVNGSSVNTCSVSRASAGSGAEDRKRARNNSERAAEEPKTRSRGALTRSRPSSCSSSDSDSNPELYTSHRERSKPKGRSTHAMESLISAMCPNVESSKLNNVSATCVASVGSEVVGKSNPDIGSSNGVEAAEKDSDKHGADIERTSFNLGNVFRGLFDVLSNRPSVDGNHPTDAKRISAEESRVLKSYKARRLDLDVDTDKDATGVRNSLLVEDSDSHCDETGRSDLSDAETTVSSSVSISEDDCESNEDPKA